MLFVGYGRPVGGARPDRVGRVEAAGNSFSRRLEIAPARRAAVRVSSQEDAAVEREEGLDSAHKTWFVLTG